MNKFQFNTYKEIYQQPELWKDVLDLVFSQKEQIEEFMSFAMSNGEADIIFTGAGSSFFIGEMVAGIFQKNTTNSCKAVSTTELVTHIDEYVNKSRPLLLVSFARSGNSPESIAAVDLASEYNPSTYHLFISCNRDGALAKREQSIRELLIALPEKANDKSLAMTSSVTSMALTALLVLFIKKERFAIQQVKLLVDLTSNVLQQISDNLEKIASKDFERVVFLGSGNMMGTAREAHLKLQELTNGEVICKFDSFLGFRHGPKAVVNEKTLMVYFVSNNLDVFPYERDLINSMKESTNPIYSLAIVENNSSDLDVEEIISFNNQNDRLNEGMWNIASLVVAQLFAFYKSIHLNLNPDNPSVNGSIHRVVQGVTIYKKQISKSLV